HTARSWPSTTSPSPSPPARSTACSAPTAPARPPPCACSLACAAPPPAPPPPPPGPATREGYSSPDEPDEVKRRVGLVSASAGLYPHLSVREMLLFFADLYGVDPGRAEKDLESLADLIGLR